MADSQIYDMQSGFQSGYATPELYRAEADASRVLYVDSCDPRIDSARGGDFAPVTDRPFQPRFSQLINPVINPLVNPRFDRNSQIVVPAYDMASAAPCVTGACDMYENALGQTSIARSQLREEDIIRLILAANSGYMDQSRNNPAHWNNPQFAVYQPGRVPPSQVQGYDVARAFVDPNYVDERGMCPSSYPSCPSTMRPNSRNPRMWVTPDQQWQGQSYQNQQWLNAQRDWQYQQLNRNQRYQDPNWQYQQFERNQRYQDPNWQYQQFERNQRYQDPNWQYQQFERNQRYQDPNWQYQQFERNQRYQDPNWQYQQFDQNQRYQNWQSQQWNRNQQWDPRQQWNRPSDGYYPGCEPGYQQWQDRGCNQRFNPYSRWNNANMYDPGCGGNGGLSQVMRYAPFVLSMINAANHGRGGFPGGYMNFNPGFMNGGFNQFNQMNRYNNFNRGFNGYGGRGSVRIGNFRIGF
jgi:hypothetical protein